MRVSFSRLRSGSCLVPRQDGFVLTDRRFSDGSYIADPASSQLRECLVKIAVLRRMVRAEALIQKRSVKQASTFFKFKLIIRRAASPRISRLVWKYKVRRFRLIYELNCNARLIRIFALGHQREVYEELGDRLREARRHK